MLILHNTTASLLHLQLLPVQVDQGKRCRADQDTRRWEIITSLKRKKTVGMEFVYGHLFWLSIWLCVSPFLPSPCWYSQLLRPQEGSVLLGLPGKHFISKYCCTSFLPMFAMFVCLVVESCLLKMSLHWRFLWVWFAVRSPRLLKAIFSKGLLG